MERTPQADRTTLGAARRLSVQPRLDAVLTHLLDDLADGVLLLDETWRITYANRSARRISRLRPEDLNSKTHWELFPATLGTPIERLYREAMQTRTERIILSFYYEPFDLWLEVRAIPAGQGLAIYYRDVTANHQAEAARSLVAGQLRAQYAEMDRNRRELETIYQGSPIGMALYEPTELRLIRVNQRQAEIFRLPAAEALGKRFTELTAGVAASHPLILRAAAGEQVLNHEIEGTLDRSSSEYRFWNVNYSPIFAPDGSVRAIAAATIEITQQKLAEAALRQSEKLAAVGRMASSIAHEINNPLESVTNLLYIARQYSVVPEVKEFLSVADQELRRVSIIANQTLRFHKQSSLPREITCSELFTTVLSLYEGRLRNSSITLEKRKRANRPIACFEGDIRQVLNNLVGNAIDAMPTGGRLLLRSREATDWRTGRKGLALTIADTGGGIPPHSRTRIFEAFFTTKGINGTGLGLWISAEIVQRHQGRLLLRSGQSQTHHGTVFSLFLPLEARFETRSTLPASAPN